MPSPSHTANVSSLLLSTWTHTHTHTHILAVAAAAVLVLNWLWHDNVCCCCCCRVSSMLHALSWKYIRLIKIEKIEKRRLLAMQMLCCNQQFQWSLSTHKCLVFSLFDNFWSVQFTAYYAYCIEQTPTLHLQTFGLIKLKHTLTIWSNMCKNALQWSSHLAFSALPHIYQFSLQSSIWANQSKNKRALPYRNSGGIIMAHRQFDVIHKRGCEQEEKRAKVFQQVFHYSLTRIHSLIKANHAIYRPNSFNFPPPNQTVYDFTF